MSLNELFVLWTGADRYDSQSTESSWLDMAEALNEESTSKLDETWPGMLSCSIMATNMSAFTFELRSLSIAASMLPMDTPSMTMLSKLPSDWVHSLMICVARGLARQQDE